MALDVDSLYRKYGPMVLRRCRYLLKDEERALDAMQDTFVKLLRYRERLTDSGPSSLLYCMATNVCLNMLRADKRRPVADGDDMLCMIASAENVEDRAVARHLLSDVFRDEKVSTRTIAVLHYVDEMTLEEVAGHVGLSVSAVRKRLRMLKKRSRVFQDGAPSAPAGKGAPSAPAGKGAPSAPAGKGAPSAPGV